MAKAYSNDLRRKLLEAYDRGEGSLRERLVALAQEKPRYGYRRRLVLPQRVKSCSLTSLQQRLVKTDGRLVKHARYHWHLLGEENLSRRLFANMLRRIVALPLPDS